MLCENDLIPNAPRNLVAISRFYKIAREEAYGNVRDSATNRGRVLDAIANTAFVGSGGKTYSMNITGYGWPDNSPPGADIAYPEVRGRTAAGGTGTFTDPITFATDSTELRKGTLIYVPHLKRYFINEDECVTCEYDWVNHVRHLDIWVGATANSPTSAVYACENAITRLPGDVIVNPPANLEVVSGSIFNASTNQCDAP